MSKEVEAAQKALEALLKSGTVVNMKKNPVKTHLVRSDKPSMNYVTDGGYPVGKMMIFAGEKSAGKTTLAIQEAPTIARETAKLKGRDDEGRILFLDNERTTTTDFIETLGQNPNIFFLHKVDTTESMMDMARQLAPAFDLVIIDSLNNSASAEQMQKTAGERTMANRAQVMTDQLPIIVGLCDRVQTSLIILSQIRENMNKANKYSPDFIIPGGQSFHHNSSLTLEMFPSTKLRVDAGSAMELYKTTTGQMTRIVCSKNKNGKRDRQVSLELEYGKGFSMEADVISSAARLNLIEKKGSWYSYDGTSLGQGMNKVKETLADNPELLEILKKEIEEIDLKSE